MASSPKNLIEAWRLIPDSAQYDPFSGKGAEKAGGRWNEKGVPMVYCASSISLAMLEILANLRGLRSNLHYLAYAINIPENACMELGNDFSKNTFKRNEPHITQAIGSHWAQSLQSLALKVPSIVNPYEFNFLINPLHPDFEKKLKFPPKNVCKRIELDPRLVEHLNNH